MSILNVVIPLLQAATITPQAVEPAAEAPTVETRAPRAGRHGLELGIGLFDHTTAAVTATAGGTTSTTSGSGVGGSLTYTYWLADDLGLSAQVGVVSVDATVSAVGTQSQVRSVSVVPLLFGVKYQPFQFRGAERVRPYLAAAVGPFIGTDAGISSGTGGASVASRTEAAAGGRAGIGLDFLASQRVMLGLGAGYRLMTDFAQPIGGERNYSGADLTLAVGVLLGGGR